ncbi:MAG TPA: nucleotidyltransferase family protein [Terriglobales bacterium]|nr:nucleotidyltransferase family protein [Terriglobales bacterium]
MRAMVLAAGLGTRLRPLTERRPKALVEVAGRTLLDITLARLRSFGIRDVIVNVHHFADLMLEYLKVNRNFGMKVAVSHEDILLDTGGGLKKAAWFFREGKSGEPFLLHNVDILSNIDLAAMIEAHKGSEALATLAVQDRKSSRHLLFDENEYLCGRSMSNKPDEVVRTVPEMQALAFCGVHVISPRFLTMMQGDGVFSIVNSYLVAAMQGERISAFRADRYYWRDLGRPEQIQRANEDVRQRKVLLPR